jgi:hypothetical protein
MDRRTLLALVASFAAAPATACSPALKSPRSSGLENNQVRSLFTAWWQRDADQFRAHFTDTLMADGSRMEPELASELFAAAPVPAETFAIYDRFFTDEKKLNTLRLIVNTDSGVFVACSEADPTLNIQSDCTGMPMQHLFLVTMFGLNPRSIMHLASSETVGFGKFSIWTDDGG